MQIRPIRTDRDHRAALAEIEKLWVASIGTPDDVARRAAEDALLDRTDLTVSPKAYAEFLARLDAPPQANERLQRTMKTSAPWEQPIYAKVLPEVRAMPGTTVGSSDTRYQLIDPVTMPANSFAR